MMFKCTKKVKQGLALFLALLMMLFITDLSGVKVRADDEEWKSDSIVFEALSASLTTYGDDLIIRAHVETTDYDAVVTYKWYLDGVELVGRTSQIESVTVDEYKSAGEHTLKCEATCGSDTVTHSMTVTIYELLTDVVLNGKLEKTYDGTTDVPSKLLDKVGFRTSDGRVLKLEKGTDYTVDAYYDSPEAGYDKAVTLKFNMLNGTYIFDKDHLLYREKEFTISGPDSGATIYRTGIATQGYTIDVDDCYAINLADYIPELTAPGEYGEITYGISEIVGLNEWYDTSNGGAKIENGVLTVPIKEPDTYFGGRIGTIYVHVNTTNYYFSFYFDVMANKLVPTGEPIFSSTSLAYGGKLGDITLSGTMEYMGSVIDGTFEWMDPNYQPEELGIHPVEWIFKPTRHNRYEEVTGIVEITVNKAPAAPNMPDKTMKVSNRTDKVGKISLPSGWVWQDADMSLNVGEAVNATAVYNGSDKGNYEVESVVISITRAEADKSDDANSDSTDDNNDNKQDADNNTNDNTTDSSKSGWEAVTSQIDSAKDGDTVTVEMNGATTVPSGVFEHLKGRDVKVLFNMANGITWTIDGKDVTEIKGDINLGVTFGGEAGKTIPVDVVNSVTGEHYSVNLTLAYNGEFGFTATLTLNVKAENAGKYANLFYYNPTDNKLEFVSFGQVGGDGNVTFTFTHASDYTIVLADSVINRVESPSTGNDGDMWRSRMIVVLGCAFMIVGMGVFYTNRKKNAEQ